jgi:hypothetical protein
VTYTDTSDLDRRDTELGDTELSDTELSVCFPVSRKSALLPKDPRRETLHISPHRFWVTLSNTGSSCGSTAVLDNKVNQVTCPCCDERVLTPDKRAQYPIRSTLSP